MLTYKPYDLKKTFLAHSFYVCDCRLVYDKCETGVVHNVELSMRGTTSQQVNAHHGLEFAGFLIAHLCKHANNGDKYLFSIRYMVKLVATIHTSL
jgi:hypothetical protein